MPGGPRACPRGRACSSRASRSSGSLALGIVLGGTAGIGAAVVAVLVGPPVEAFFRLLSRLRLTAPDIDPRPSCTPRSAGVEVPQMGTVPLDIDRGGSMLAELGGLGIVGILVVILIIVAIVYFARRT